MRRLIYLASARADLGDILRFVTRESGDMVVGRRFVAALRHRCERLADLPGTLGEARPELRPDLRSIPHNAYVIFFRYQEDRVEIVNVLSGHRDIEQFFRS